MACPVPRLRHRSCSWVAVQADGRTQSFSVPVRFLTEEHVSAQTRKLDPVVTVALVERGAGILTDRIGSYPVRGGDVVVFGPEAEFRYDPIRPLRISIATIDEELLLEAVAWTHGKGSTPGRARVRIAMSTLRHPVVVLHPARAESERLRRLIRSAIAHQIKDVPRSPLGVFATVARLMEIVDPLVMQQHPNPQFALRIQAAAGFHLPEVSHAGVARALRFVATRPAAQWSVAALARAASLSVGYFTRAFVAEIGLSPRQFLSQQRLVEFTILIRSTSLTIDQAVRQVGWSSTSHAIAVFRVQTGMTPSQYRNRATSRPQSTDGSTPPSGLTDDDTARICGEDPRVCSQSALSATEGDMARAGR